MDQRDALLRRKEMQALMERREERLNQREERLNHREERILRVEGRQIQTMGINGTVLVI
jgi:hypothetical protein